MTAHNVVFKCRVGDRALVVGVAHDGKHIEPVEVIGHHVVVAKPCIRDGKPAWRLRKPIPFTVSTDKTFNDRHYRAGHRLLAVYIADAALQPIRGDELMMERKSEAA